MERNDRQSFNCGSSSAATLTFHIDAMSDDRTQMPHTHTHHPPHVTALRHGEMAKTVTQTDVESIGFRLSISLIQFHSHGQVINKFEIIHLSMRSASQRSTQECDCMQCGAVITNYYYYCATVRMHVHRSPFYGLSRLGLCAISIRQRHGILFANEKSKLSHYRPERNANSWLLARHQIH